MDFNQRIGDVFKMVSFQFKSTITAASNNPPTIPPANVRMMIIQYKQPNGVAPIAADILQDGTTPGNIHSPLDLASRGQFRVYFDRHYAVQQLSGTSSVVLTGFKKLNFRTVCFNGVNAATIANITTNALYLITMTDQGTGGQIPSQTIDFRMRFVG